MRTSGNTLCSTWIPQFTILFWINTRIRILELKCASHNKNFMVSHISDILLILRIEDHCIKYFLDVPIAKNPYNISCNVETIWTNKCNMSLKRSPFSSLNCLLFRKWLVLGKTTKKEKNRLHLFVFKTTNIS